MRILFTGGGGAGTQALWDLLSDRYDLHFADADPRRISPVVPAERRHALPMAVDPAFRDTTVALCARLGVDVLVPGVDEELEVLAEARGALGSTRVLLPDTAFVTTMLDKYATAAALTGAGVTAPVTALLDDCDSWNAFPCIVKPRRGRGSRGVSVVSDAVELSALAAGLGPQAGTYVVQEMVIGDEYSVQVVVDDSGRLRAVFPARILLKRGITLSAVSQECPAVLRACEAIARAFPTPGCYNVQGIVADDDVFVPFEINPRVSTTLCLAVAAGIDPFALAAGAETTPGLAPLEAGVRLERYWVNEITRTTDEG